LTCTPRTLTARILGRPDAEGSHAWCLAHQESGLAAANDPRFGIAAPTDGQAPGAVAETILRHLLARGLAAD
jgi:hypothetical protein